MNLKTIHELLKGWLATGFKIQCAACPAEDMDPAEIKVEPGEYAMSCPKCGYPYQVLELFYDKLNELKK